MKTIHETSYNGKWSIDIEKGKWITIRWVRDGKMKSNRFEIGDQAEYDSYNLSYYGPIKSITEKTVTIDKGRGYSRARRLKISEFAWRNYDFDLAKTAEENSKTSMYI